MPATRATEDRLTADQLQYLRSTHRRMVSVVDEIRLGGARDERARLRALHRAWPGHPVVCSVCTVLLGEPKP